LKNFEFDRIVCNHSENLDRLLPPKSVSLSIVVPPYVYLKNYYSEIKELKKMNPKEWEEKSETGKHLAFIEKSLKKIANVTKPGGICCIFLSNDMDPEDDVMIPSGSRTFVKILSSEDVLDDWEIEGEFIWVKASKESVESVEPVEEGTLISFDKTPFSTIYILVRKGGDEPNGILERLDGLRVSEDKKTEISDSVWFVPFESKNGIRDHIPKEIILRLIMVYSNENDLVLDPFSEYGITAIASKILKRHYFCLVDNKEKIPFIKKRLKIY